MTSKKIICKTPTHNGGTYVIIDFFDEDGNPIEEKLSTKCIIHEFNDKDIVICRTYGILNKNTVEGVPKEYRENDNINWEEINRLMNLPEDEFNKLLAEAEREMEEIKKNSEKQMIDIVKACELVTKKLHEPYVEVITDIGHSFVIGVLTIDGESLDESPLMVNKYSGKISVCFVPEHFKELQGGKKISIPEKYRFIK